MSPREAIKQSVTWALSNPIEAIRAARDAIYISPLLVVVAVEYLHRRWFDGR